MECLSSEPADPMSLFMQREIESDHATQCNIDEDLIVTTAKLMKSLGLQVRAVMIVFLCSALGLILSNQDVGYTHVNLDDCYSEKNRSTDGFILPGAIFLETVASCARLINSNIDHVRFKSGFKNLTDQLHTMGL